MSLSVTDSPRAANSSYAVDRPRDGARLHDRVRRRCGHLRGRRDPRGGHVPNRRAEGRPGGRACVRPLEPSDPSTDGRWSHPPPVSCLTGSDELLAAERSIWIEMRTHEVIEMREL